MKKINKEFVHKVNTDRRRASLTTGVDAVELKPFQERNELELAGVATRRASVGGGATEQTGRLQVPQGNKVAPAPGEAALRKIGGLHPDLMAQLSPKSDKERQLSPAAGTEGV